MAASSAVARRTMRRRTTSPPRSPSPLCGEGEGGRGFARLHPLQPPAHFFAAIGPTADTRPRSCPRSTSTITESWRASGSADGQEKYSFRFPLNRTSMTSVNSLLAQRTHRKVLLLPPFEELLDPDLAEMPQVATEGLAERRGRRFGVGVRPTRRLGDDLVDDPELQQILGRDLQGLGGPLPLARVLPEDGRAALGVGHAEIAMEVLLRVAALLVPDHHHAHAVEPGPPPDDRRIVTEQAVAVQLDEVGEHRAQVVERVRSLRVAGHLHALHRRQVLVDLGAQLGQSFLERGELLGDVHRRLARHALQLLDLALQLEQRTLEVQRVGRHRQVVRTRCTWSGPSSARSASTRSSAASTWSERLRSRVTPGSRPGLALTPGASPGTLPPPFPDPSSHSTSTGAGPGWAAHRAATARVASGGGGASGDQRSATPIAPLAFRSSSA